MEDSKVTELRPRRPIADREIMQLAATDFEPWPVPECTPQSLLMACERPAFLGYALMLQPKTDLVALLRDIGIDQQRVLAAEIATGADKLRSIVEMMDGAVARMAVASASIAIADASPT